MGSEVHFWHVRRKKVLYLCLFVLISQAPVKGLQPGPGALPELPDFDKCDWREGQAHKMHWPQLPDLTPLGMDVDLRAHLADDFRCTQTGPITDVHIWGGFRQDLIAAGGLSNLTFELSIYADIPATADRWSRPGELLWQRNFGPNDYHWRLVSDEIVGWLEPTAPTYWPNDHHRTIQFNFCIEEEPFTQKEGTIYWLGVRVQTNTSAFSLLGWRSALPHLQWNDAAVFQVGTQWLPLFYPSDHELGGKRLDLAFVITGNPDPPPGKDLGDAPDSSNSWGNAPMTAYPVGPVQARYPTVHVAGSPSHGPKHHDPERLAFLGNQVTFEVEADLGPDTDVVNNIRPPLDAPNRDGADDSIQLPLVLPPCEKTSFDYDVTVTSLALPMVYVNVWFDWNRDGDWNDRELCPNGEVVPEWTVQNQVIPIAALGTFSYTTPTFLSWHPLSQDERNPLWMRITLAEVPWDATLIHGGAGPSSGYKFGETEDYLLYPRLTPHEDRYDWGDAPDRVQAPIYPTLAVNNGARHIPEGPWFGDAADMPDVEPDGQPDPNAFGDDLDTLYPLLGVNDDEDGVSVPPLVPGQPGDITLEVNGGGGFVDAWIDFNGDGAWVAAEKIFGGFLPDGIHVITVSVPGSALSGMSYARFRISRNGGLPPDGPARDGEVEDHWVHIWEVPPDVKWLQLPDVTQNGIDIRFNSSPGIAAQSLADDFECTCFGYITDIHFWGSWKKDQKGSIQQIRVLIRPDDPIGPGGHEPDNRYSKPGPEILWQGTFSSGQFKEGLYHQVYKPGEWWWDPVTGELVPGGDQGIWEIHIEVDREKAFLQRGTPENPIIYWLEIQVRADDGEFGWKTRRWPDHYMDDAVMGVPSPSNYWELRYPKGHPYHEKQQDSIDLAFYLTCHPEPDDKPTFRPMSHTFCPALATVCPTVLTHCPPKTTFCRPVATACPAVKTHCPPVQTKCRPKRTRCPVVQTRCPSLQTRCPAVTTLCPPVITECPPTATECYIAETRCPPVATLCPPVLTECPPTETECHSVQTRCPPVTTRCPPVSTECPPTVTECFALETQCPPIATQCPPIVTECPPMETECHSVQTRCPPVTTRCPPVSTECPPTVTECFALDTQCPPIATKCPPIVTECPPTETECHSVQTRCPPVTTRCPPVSTECPPTVTECFALDTQCPPIATKCPPIITECPPTETECFTVQTRCPPITTSCPLVLTECPPTATECLAVETQCPPVTTKCPPVLTECPSTETECFTVQTRCPPIKTQCPPILTECPPTETECQIVQTRCPPILTECPPTATECFVAHTQCPPVLTECPAQFTRCPPSPTGCDIIAGELEPRQKLPNTGLATSCPAIEADCPLVDAYRVVNHVALKEREVMGS